MNNNIVNNPIQNQVKDNVGPSGIRKVFNVGKEFMNFGMYMAEGRNFNTNSKEQPQKRYYNRNNINNTRQEDIKENLQEKDPLVYYGILQKDSDWDGYGFKLENIKKITPIEINGKLSLWDYDYKDE